MSLYKKVMHFKKWSGFFGPCTLYIAQLSQRDSATAAWVSFSHNWKTIFCRHYGSIFNHCDLIGLQS